jgi:hypothetical protein
MRNGVLLGIGIAAGRVLYVLISWSWGVVCIAGVGLLLAGHPVQAVLVAVSTGLLIMGLLRGLWRREG